VDITSNIYRGKIKATGQATVNVDQGWTVYSFIELEDGQILRDFRSPRGIDGELGIAVKEGLSVELHFLEVKAKKENRFMLFAVRRPDAKLFATRPLPLAILKLFCISWAVLGALLTFFVITAILGLPMLFIVWVRYKELKVLSKYNAGIRGLSNPILI
jgi:hypothetical protein